MVETGRGDRGGGVVAAAAAVATVVVVVAVAVRDIGMMCTVRAELVFSGC